MRLPISGAELAKDIRQFECCPAQCRRLEMRGWSGRRLQWLRSRQQIEGTRGGADGTGSQFQIPGSRREATMAE